MDLNRLTQKSQEALHDAQTKALRFGHTEVDGEHLLLALLGCLEGTSTLLELRRQGGQTLTDKLRTASGMDAKHLFHLAHCCTQALCRLGSATIALATKHQSTGGTAT